MLIKELTAIIEETERLDEKTVAIDPTSMPLEGIIETLEKRLAAARQALSLAHKLKDADSKKRHFSAIMTNMNIVRNQLNKIIRDLEGAASRR